MISIKHLFNGFFLLFLGTSTVFAQFGYYEDALRFSQFTSNGSARIIGLGGAQMSLGGDVSNIHTNPAGLGFFRRSEFSFSPSFGTWNTESNYLGQVKTERTGNFAIPNLSLVISNPRQGALNTSAFKGGSFGISFNRMNHFNSQFGYFSDVEGESSIQDFFVNDANGFNTDQVQNFGLTGLAYQTFLINPVIDENGNHVNNEWSPITNTFPFQDETVISEGRVSQTSLSYGANFLNKFFVGAGLGLSSVIYNSRKNYREEFFNEPLLNSTLDERLSLSGFGANINLGVIYKPVDQLNLGINFQSPTWYNFNEEFEARMVNNFDNFFFEPENITLGSEEASSPITIGNYNLNTPLRLSGGATIFIGKSGFISADIDYLDYSKSTINSRDFNATADNQQIRSLYGQTLNYRVGAEYRFHIWRVRGGYGFYGDPFVNSSFDRKTQQYSGGFGVRLKSIYADFALSSTNFRQLYNSFPVEDGGFNIGPFSEIRNNITTGILTFGFNF